jgi:hypothetical protein
MNLREVCVADCIRLSQDVDQWHPLVKLEFYKRLENFDWVA